MGDLVLPDTAVKHGTLIPGPHPHICLQERLDDDSCVCGRSSENHYVFLVVDVEHGLAIFDLLFVILFLFQDACFFHKGDGVHLLIILFILPVDLILLLWLLCPIKVQVWVLQLFEVILGDLFELKQALHALDIDRV